jgi:hypothetical protein
MKVTRTSIFTGNSSTMDLPVTVKQLDEWRGGKLIQKAMPDLTPDQREFLMTGATPQEWKKMFGSEDTTL